VLCENAARAFYFPHHRVDESNFERLIEQPAVEIAVVANRGTERDVDVEAEHSF
jgi:hypothetical protein